VLGTIAWDLGRFGVQFVASPRHAGGLVITGPVSKNTEPALKKTWDAMPEPKIAIAVGTSAVSGGPFAGHSEVTWARLLLCRLICSARAGPPHPITVLDGLLRLLCRLDGKRTK
jgi:Ni,Fe-hydrogenase III small subunit